MLLHATGVVRHGAAVLLTGPPGAGKSDLALRLIDRGWQLLADDQVRLEVGKRDPNLPPGSPLPLPALRAVPLRSGEGGPSRIPTLSGTERDAGEASGEREGTQAMPGPILIAHSPPTTRGLIELRGIGIVTLEVIPQAPVALLVALGSETERLPEPAHEMLLGIAIPHLVLDPRPASAPIKLEHAFARARAALEAGGT